MSGKILRFKKPKTSKTSKLKFVRLELYEEGVMANFSLDAPHAEYRFSLTEAQEIDDAFAIYRDADNLFHIVEHEHFNDTDVKTLESVVSEARDIMQDQLKLWSELAASERIGLQIQWAVDLQAELGERFRNISARSDIEDSLGVLADMLAEIDGLGHFISGLHTAQSCL